MDESFRSTLVVLPLVVAGLWVIGGWVRRRGGKVLSEGSLALAAAAVVLCLLAILGHRHLGLDAGGAGAERLLAGALALVLAVHVAALVRALAECGQADRGSGSLWPFFALPLVVYLAILPWSLERREPDGDEPQYLLITHSLAWDFDTDLTNNYADQDSLRFMSRALTPEWPDPLVDDRRRFSRHSPLLPMVLALPYRLAGRWGASVAMAILTAAVAWSSLRLAQSYWPTFWRETVWVWALLTLTPPLVLYSHQIWAELPAALLLVTGLRRLPRLVERGGGAAGDRLVVGAVLVLLPLLKLRFALLSVSLLALAWWRGGRSRRLTLALVAVLVATLVGILLFNQIMFDRPVKDHTIDQLLRIQLSPPGQYLEGLLGLFWDCAFGLFASNPLWLLLAPAILLVVRRRSPVVGDLLFCCLPYLLVISPRQEWYGAWSPPFRFGLVLLPLLTLAVVPLLARTEGSRARTLIGGLATPALALSLLWLVEPGWAYNLAVGTNHLVDYLAQRWAADVGRFLPSFVRPRAASFWLPLVVTATAVLLAWRSGKPAGAGSSRGVAALLLAVAALPLAARAVPTHWAEFEDRQVIKQGGELYPPPWLPYRPRFRGGWRLEPGASVRVPVVPGGRRVSLRVDLQISGAADGSQLELAAGGEALGRWPLTGGPSWQTLSVSDRLWPPGAPLVASFVSEDGDGTSPRLLLDRVRFEWR